VEYFLDFSFDFPVAFSLLKRALIFFVMIILVLSYYHGCEPYAKEFDKLLRAFTTFNPKSRVLKK